MSYTKKVRQFTLACNDNISRKPVKMSKEAVNFVSRMVKDELQELELADSIPEQADALVDAIYYICDCAVKHGVNLDRLFKIVHAANMKKVVNGKVVKRKDGKILKPKSWVDPNPMLEAEIDRQTKEGSF